jgi:hypothetical protein
MAETAAGEMAVSGMVTADGKPSPWVSIYMQATKALSGLALRLWLGPQSRASKAPKTKPRAWFEVARFCAYGRQCEALELRPWQPPPMWADAADDGPDDGVMGWARAAELLRRMLSLGISRWHPSPLEALAEADAARRVHVENKI